MPLKKLNVKVKNKLKSELINLAILSLLTMIIFKIVLYKESFIIIFLTTLRFFYSIMLPALFLSLYLHKKFTYATRLILGVIIVFALTSILNYYLGLFGVHIKFHPYILPPLFIIVGFLLFLKKDGTS